MRARILGAALAALALLPATASRAADRYALIVSGAAGSAEYTQQYNEWRTSLAAILKARFGFADDHVVMLADPPGGEVRVSSRDNVRAAFAALDRRATRDDQVLIVLIGHGNASDADGGAAKFNLVGPDLTAREWADLVKAVPGRVVFVDTSSGSAQFLQALSARGRVVITAADATAQAYETVFPRFFVRAFTADEADADKDGRVSIWEAFSYASAQVRSWYEQQGRLQTERALLDDNGDGTGREAQSPGDDGALARTTFLDQPAAPPRAAGASPDLQRRRDAVQAQIDDLKARKPAMTDAQYQSEMERLLVELAQIDAQLRAR